MKSYIDQGRYYADRSHEEVKRCVNGMGAEWMPKKARQTLDRAFKEFKDCVIIHDVDYCYGLTPEDKEDADKRFLKNMNLACWHEIPWYLPLKYLRFRVYARIIYRACVLWGDKAFEDAKP